MKANELRIGNKALWTNKEITIDSGDIALCELVGCEFSGIPLTEEWLIKFGFNGWDKGNYTMDIYNGRFLKVIECSMVILAWDIKHVHQLQNLYFALTEKELTIKQ